MAEPKAVIHLPWPPSTNHLFVNAKNGKGRFKSQHYVKWLETAGWLLKAAKPAKFKGRVNIGIELCPPDRRKRDGDNLVKPILDLLVAHQVIEDDSNKIVRETAVRWVENSVHSCSVTVEAA